MQNLINALDRHNRISIAIRWLAWVVKLGVISFLCGVGLAGILGVGFVPQTSAELANWVQAIGSILALWVAFHVGSEQAKYARQQAETSVRKSARLLSEARQTALEAFRTARFVDGLVENVGNTAALVNEWQSLFEPQLQEDIQRLAKILPEDLENDAQASAIRSLKRGLEEIAATLNGAQTDKVILRSIFDTTIRRMQVALEAFPLPEREQPSV